MDIQKEFEIEAIEKCNQMAVILQKQFPKWSEKECWKHSVGTYVENIRRILNESKDI